MALTDQLRIETPEQIALELPIAGLGSRFLAMAIDTVIQVLSYIAAAVVLAFTGPWIASQALHLPAMSQSFLLALFVLFGFCVYWGYFALFEIFWKGQTPGKRIAGIRVIKETGRPLDALSGVLRNLLRAIDFLPGLYAAGITCMMLNAHSRRLGDLVAGTVVVHDKPPARIAAEWMAAERNIAPLGSVTPQIAKLSDQELLLIETYLQRRYDMDGYAQENTRNQIAARISTRTGLTPDPGQSVDDFLEGIAQKIRDTARLR